MINADTLDDQGRNPGFDDPAARLQPPPNVKIAISVDGGLYVQRVSIQCLEKWLVGTLK